MRLAFALTSALSIAALAQPAPEAPPAAAPTPAPAAPAAATPAPTPPEPAAATPQPAPAPPPVKPAEPAAPAAAPTATAQPATPTPAQPPPAAPAATAVPATATARTPSAVVPVKGTAGLTLPVGPPPQDKVRARAKSFFHSMQQADARGIVELAAFPFFIENRRFDQPEELIQEWAKQLRAKRTDLLVLYGIEVYTPAEMEKKYGKPPARLKDLPLRGGEVYVVVANLSGHAAVAVFRDVDDDWRVIAYTD